MIYFEAKQIIKKCLLAKLPCFIWGGPGIGKSSCVREICDEENTELFDIRLSLLDPTDLRGLPFPNKTRGIVEWLVPDFLPPSNSKQKIVLFLDEFNCAPKQVQMASLQLLLDRKLGNYILPENAAIIAAGNREEDMAFVNILSSAVCNRLVHIHLNPDIDSWTNWAVSHNILPEIVGFLNFRPELLFKLTGEKSFPSPRTWVMASELINKTKITDIKEIKTIISCCVGDGVMSEFISWYKNYKDIDVKSILQGKYPDLESKNASYKYAIIIALGYYLQNHGFKNSEANIANFLKLFNPEYRVLFLKALKKEELVRQLCMHKSMKEMASQILKVTIGEI
ncbi:MAG: AAA family ATPase [Elusimicrobiota bacterium]